MQLHQIRYFLALCEERSFTRAARRSGVSQPSSTNAIATLEQELGGALFHRRPLVAVTALGQAVHPYLKRIAANADHARQVARELTRARAAQSDAGVSNHRSASGMTGRLDVLLTAAALAGWLKGCCARDTPWVALPEDRYYRRDLALIHHRGFGFHALACAPGISDSNSRLPRYNNRSDKSCACS